MLSLFTSHVVFFNSKIVLKQKVTQFENVSPTRTAELNRQSKDLGQTRDFNKLGSVEVMVRGDEKGNLSRAELRSQSMASDQARKVS